MFPPTLIRDLIKTEIKRYRYKLVGQISTKKQKKSMALLLLREYISINRRYGPLIFGSFKSLLLFMIGARYIPSAEAGLIGLLDVVLGPIWVWWVFSEEPSRAALIGGGIVLAAVLWHMTGEIKRERAAP